MTARRAIVSTNQLASLAKHIDLWIYNAEPDNRSSIKARLRYFGRDLRRLPDLPQNVQQSPKPQSWQQSLHYLIGSNQNLGQQRHYCLILGKATVHQVQYASSLS